ncbi:hypothetical protein M0813_24191 [Anaeramoeba flamelloides]|uniref:Uncharacterized protein n=1 Tax=Anaeramoeba flamelloides TaxID=1746091 RepID=A0ABQ8Y6M9_9EUKA|nr:hypothetical protein M0813_24191 [Anaeramoeba flamelloides]
MSSKLFQQIIKDLIFLKNKIPKKKKKNLKKIFQKSTETVLLINLAKFGVIIDATQEAARFFKVKDKKTLLKYNYEMFIPIKQNHLNKNSKDVILENIQSTVNGETDPFSFWHQCILRKPIFTNVFYTVLIIDGQLHVQCLIRYADPPEEKEDETSKYEKLDSLKFNSKIFEFQNLQKMNESIFLENHFEDFFTNIVQELKVLEKPLLMKNVIFELQKFQNKLLKYLEHDPNREKYLKMKREIAQSQKLIHKLKKEEDELKRHIKRRFDSIEYEKVKTKEIEDENVKLETELEELKKKLSQENEEEKLN